MDYCAKIERQMELLTEWLAVLADDAETHPVNDDDRREFQRVESMLLNCVALLAEYDC